MVRQERGNADAARRPQACGHSWRMFPPALVAPVALLMGVFLIIGRGEPSAEIGESVQIRQLRNADDLAYRTLLGFISSLIDMPAQLSILCH
jgi:hypothetical protein